MKIKLSIILMMLNCFVFAELKTINTLTHNGERITINYDDECKYYVYSETYINSKINYIKKNYEIKLIVDTYNYKDFNNWLDYAKIMSIGKYYGGAFGFYKNMKFEVIPSYNHTTNKSNVYLILYK